MSVARPLTRHVPRLRCARPFSSTPAAAFPRKPPRTTLPPPHPESHPEPRTEPTAYTRPDIEELQQHYSREQVAGLLAGEQSISRQDFTRAAPRRGDAMNLNYLDDLAQFDPLLDFPQGEPSDDDVRTDKYGWPIPRQPLPRLEDPNLTFPKPGEDNDDMFKPLSEITGLSIPQLKNLSVKTLVLHRVVNQTRMGKIQSMYSLSIAGNKDGLLGIGEGKATEVEDAERMSKFMAIRNMVPIPRYEGRTTFGDVEIKVGAVEMLVMTRPPGFGVRCSENIFEMCRAAGIKDLSARVTRSRNPMNVIKTFMEALQRQKLPETIARGRGMKFVDVRKVYYGGLTV